MLTVSETKTYDYIRQFMSNNRHAPTTAEIAAGIGIASRGVVYRYLKALQKKGYIKLTPNRHRNIVLQENSTQLFIPLVGKIAAGNPIEAIEQQDSINVADIFLGEGRYALRVQGDSMVDEGIHDGDIIICEQSDIAGNGQIVVALIDNQEATLKRLFYNDNKTITLVPANAAYQAQTYQSHRIEIQGIYLGLLRMV